MAIEVQTHRCIEIKVVSKGMKQCELHACLRLAMRLCRWAGVFPVQGLDRPSLSGLRFNLKFPYMLYLCSMMLCQVVTVCLSIYNFFVSDFDLNNLTSVIFYLTGLISSMFLIKLARNWPKLMHRAADIEDSVACIRSSTEQNKCKRIACFVMILALMEHVLSVIFKMKYVIHFYKDLSINSRLVEKYFTTNTIVFKYTSFSMWKAVLYEVAILQSTFLWNFTDAMTMCFSIYLISYFNDLNKTVERQQHNKEVINWKKVRVYYSYLVELVHEVDHHICWLILLSFFTNLFFICVQLFKVMKPLAAPEYLIYYSYSFLFLFIRTMVTSLLAAHVNTVARRPIFILLYLPESQCSIDVQRFIRQIRYTTTALSGFFFYITRGMILTVIGTVVKYELVLLQ